MQNLRNAVLSYVRITVPGRGRLIPVDTDGRYRCLQLLRPFSSSTNVDQDQVVDRVVELVKKFDKIEAAKVTETADFQKDLSLDSLDRVELVMAFEEEFSIEIPDAEADKLKCCADVAKYVISQNSKVSGSS